jgi:hypothetical protein
MSLWRSALIRAMIRGTLRCRCKSPGVSLYRTRTNHIVGLRKTSMVSTNLGLVLTASIRSSSKCTNACFRNRCFCCNCQWPWNNLGTVVALALARQVTAALGFMRQHPCASRCLRVRGRHRSAHCRSDHLLWNPQPRPCLPCQPPPAVRLR